MPRAKNRNKYGSPFGTPAMDNRLGKDCPREARERALPDDTENGLAEKLLEHFGAGGLGRRLSEFLVKTDDQGPSELQKAARYLVDRAQRIAILHVLRKGTSKWYDPGDRRVTIEVLVEILQWAGAGRAHPLVVSIMQERAMENSVNGAGRATVPALSI